MELKGRVKDYYFEHAQELPDDKRFHFATRIATWDKDPRAFVILREMKDEIVRPGSLEAFLREMIDAEPKKTINAYSQRLPYFKIYPQLYGIHSALFRIRHIKSVYGIDETATLYRLISPDRLDDISEKLVNDTDALMVLSTYAINFLYLYKQILRGETGFLDLRRIINLKDRYDLSDARHIQLLIYLYTHCIIGASNFYTEKVAYGQKEYAEMLDILEALISDKFDHINLDNKLEYLVAARIIGNLTNLADRIYDECRASVSTQGNFLVDRHNSSAQEDRVTFEKSEHRSVLFIMGTTPYSPAASPS